LKERIESAIPGSQAEVTGDDGVHFAAEVVAPHFEGLSRIEQHKLVYEALDNEVGGRIHALQLKTSTPRS
jgi:stress-induced morphogen